MRRRDVLRRLALTAAAATVGAACDGVARPSAARFFRIGSLSPAGAICLADPLSVRALIAETRLDRDAVAVRHGPAAYLCWDGLWARELATRGYRQGQNFEWVAMGPADPDARSKSDYARAASFAVAAELDILITLGAPAAFAAKAATTTVPILAFNLADVVETGLVESLARPGGNITARSVRTSETGVKCVQLLKEAFPEVTSPMLVFGENAYDSANAEYLTKPTADAARALGLTPHVIPPDGTDFKQHATSALDKGADSLVDVLPGQPVYQFIKDHRLPAVSAWSHATDHGFPLGYGPDESDWLVMLADYTDRILRGAHPRDLPIVNPSTTELAVNLTQAAAVGLTIPPAIVARASRVIK
jgi:putative ABC transport system substrate-binding protein